LNNYRKGSAGVNVAGLKTTAKFAEMNLNITKETLMVKEFSSKTALRISSESVQIHKKDGYSDVISVERDMREAKIFKIDRRNSEILNLIVTRE
jgi:alkylation response protein AidB-like acyl-CoA dehydrogenase